MSTPPPLDEQSIGEGANASEIVFKSPKIRSLDQ